MQRPIPEAGEDTRVLLVHAPYPGRLKFDGLPSSLLHAIAPFAASGTAEAMGETLGYLDPGTPSEAFYGRLRELVAGGRLRAACISTSTAAIEETLSTAAALPVCSWDVTRSGLQACIIRNGPATLTA